MKKKVAKKSTVPSGLAQSEPQAPGKMSEEELAYRTMLQEAILWATSQVMKEREVEIKERALARVKQLKELRG